MDYLSKLRTNTTLRQKIIYTVVILAIYRLLVAIPVPFVDITALMSSTLESDGGFGGFLMLLGGTLESFSILAVGLAPFINASIIMQLMTAVVPHFEELMEEGESGSKKIQQYTRRATFPLAFLQGIGMVYFINYLFGGSIIDVASISVVLLGAFVLAVGAMIMLWL
jgi:preprotein translocase subunit SecY